MLPTPQELREQSRIFRDATRKAATPELKRRLAQYALSLALAAESVERGGQIPDTVLVALREQEHLLTEALDDGAPVPPAPPRQPKTVPNVRDQIRAWRMRAEELRTAADQFRVPSAQDTLRRAAANYETLANNLESQICGHPLRAKRRPASSLLANSGGPRREVRINTYVLLLILTRNPSRHY